jgi:hypothetical protein
VHSLRTHEKSRLELNDLVTFFKYFVWVAGGFLAILALISVSFFGFDVRAARKQMTEDHADLRKIIDNARTMQDEARKDNIDIQDKTRSNQKDLDKVILQQAQEASKFASEREQFIREARDRLADQTSAFKNQQEEYLRDAKDRLEKIISDAEAGFEETGAAVQALAEPRVSPATDGDKDHKRSDEDLIRDLIKTSKFKWTTIDRLVRGTGLKPDKITEMARSMTDIYIGRGRKSGDTIFRFKEDDDEKPSTQ